MDIATHSQLLWSRIRLANGRLGRSSDAFWTSAALRENYLPFLVELHHIVCGGLELMRFAASRARLLNGDPVADLAAAYLDRHIEEEYEHAAWLLDDIETLGLSPRQVRASEPSPHVIDLLGRQYFRIGHDHPVAVFGYLLVFEGSPPLIEELDEIERRTGLPRTGFRCLRSHAEDDPEHLAQLNRTLDSMPLSPEQLRRISLSCFEVIDAAAALLDSLAATPASSPHPEPVHA